jgi:hypothetical protein
LPFKPHCKVEQLIIQSEPKFPFEKRYLISRPLWDALDHLNRAAAILHEVVYRDAVNMGHQNSMASRYYNSLLFSNSLERLDSESYLKLVSDKDGLGFGVRNAIVRNARESTRVSFVLIHEPVGTVLADQLCRSVDHRLATVDQLSTFRSRFGSLPTPLAQIFLDSLPDRQARRTIEADRVSCDGQPGTLVGYQRDILTKTRNEDGGVDPRNFGIELTQDVASLCLYNRIDLDFRTRPVLPAFPLCHKEIKDDDL